jgi:hypothetical protein
MQLWDAQVAHAMLVDQNCLVEIEEQAVKCARISSAKRLSLISFLF